MDAIVTAGGIPLPEEPLYEATQGSTKSLLDIAGKPMIQWVLDALSAARTIERVILVGMTEKSPVKCSKPVFYVPNQGRMVDNMRAGGKKVREVNPKAEYVLFVSSDIPGITGEMVDWVVNAAMETKDDIYYNVIRREVMEKRYPGCKRTWTKLQDMEVCGGDMNVGRLSLLTDEDNGFWEKITASRKNPLKQAAMVGFGMALRLATGRLTLKQAADHITSKLGLTGRAIECPYAEVGMDVDKIFQLEIMRADLGKQVKKAARLADGKKKVATVKAKKVVKAVKKPVAKKPAAKKPVAKKPVAKKPAVKKPAAKSPAAKKPAKK